MMGGMERHVPSQSAYEKVSVGGAAIMQCNITFITAMMLGQQIQTQQWLTQ